LKHQA
jgi:hypothetical protein